MESGSVREQLTQAQATFQSLQAQLALPKKTATNSSLPRSVSHKKKCEKSIGKWRGGKPGHLGVSRSRQEPEIVIECRCEVCPTCGANLNGVAGERIGSHQVLELSPTKAGVVEFRLYKAPCTCGAREEGLCRAGYEDVQQDFRSAFHLLVRYLNGTHHIAQDRLEQKLVYL